MKLWTYCTKVLSHEINHVYRFNYTVKNSDMLIDTPEKNDFQSFEDNP